MAVLPGQAAAAAFLTGLSGGPPTETHISAVFRGTETAWKLKKAVRLGFLDFSAVGERRRFLERELALNAPHVPGLYQDVVPLVRRAGGIGIGGEGDVVDWVLRMRAVPDDDFLDRMAEQGRVDAALLTALGDVVAEMHAAQPLAAVGDPLARMSGVLAGNAAAARAAGLDHCLVGAWQDGVAAALDRAGARLTARAPLVRRAHGDLHLGNMLMWRGRPAPFDALEFDEALATIDPGYDLAFLLMDLDRMVSRAAANLVLGRYVARTGDAGLVAGLAPFLSLRAMIRAHVTAARGQPADALVEAAFGYLDPGRPTGRAVVLAVGGLMGSGKTTLARAVAPGLGAAPGALVVRSDEVRKRLFGALPEQNLSAAAYTAAAHERTGAALLEAVGAAAGAGHAVVADATFLGAASRRGVAEAARRAGAAFLGVWLDAPLGVLERRVAGRRGDASDADVAVLREAARAAARPDDWLVVDATDAEWALAQVTSRLTNLG